LLQDPGEEAVLDAAANVRHVALNLAQPFRASLAKVFRSNQDISIVAYRAKGRITSKIGHTVY
jgi:hypothetical protein